MKSAHKNTTPDTAHLVDLLSSSHLLEEKVRVNLYLPKVFVQIMDAKAKSRSEYVKKMMISHETNKKNPKKTTTFDPYGMFANAKITDADIDEVTKSWDKHVEKLVNEL